MSRGRRQAIPPPPSQQSRGIPRAGQNPDPSWYGQRARGEAHAQPHHDPVIEHFIEYRADLEARALAVQGNEIASVLDERIYSMLTGRRSAQVLSEPSDHTHSRGEWRSYPLDPVIEPNRTEHREGDGWNFYVAAQNNRVSGSMHVELRDISAAELADAMAAALEGLRRKKTTRLSFLHPGSRKLRLD